MQSVSAKDAPVSWLTLVHAALDRNSHDRENEVSRLHVARPPAKIETLLSFAQTYNKKLITADSKISYINSTFTNLLQYLNCLHYRYSQANSQIVVTHLGIFQVPQPGI
jgi:hypothetical protein